MNWTSEQRKLSELKAWDHNPRHLTPRQEEKLTESIRRFGQVIPYSIGPDNQIYDGHQRKHVMKMMEEYGQDCIVDVRVSERELTDDERRELVIRLHENTGDWNFDELANLYDFEELGDWGFNEKLLDYFMNPTFEPVSEDEQPRLDQKKPVKCPHCGKEFVPSD